MNNPRGGRDYDKEKELMGEAGNMGREKKREVYVYRVITSANQRRILSLWKELLHNADKLSDHIAGETGTEFPFGRGHTLTGIA